MIVEKHNNIVKGDDFLILTLIFFICGLNTLGWICFIVWILET